jgi:hypothetical protein
MYSREWTPLEDKHVKEVIGKIWSGHPKGEIKGHMPFVHLPELLGTQNSNRKHTNSSEQTNPSTHPPKELFKLTSKNPEPNLQPKKTIIKLKLNKPPTNELTSSITQKNHAPSAPHGSSNVRLTETLVPIKSKDKEALVPRTNDSKMDKTTKTKAAVG